ncbi:MAG: hypothetical protein H5U40_09320, partial [Polyangiaceae bacterium]|nr:hypothetical protein [Polyangiaceae bacterium]
MLALLAGCARDEAPGAIGRGEQALAHPGPWLISDATLSIGDTQYVEYTGAGAWNPDNPACAGGIQPGASILGSYLYDHFPQITLVGGYSCRPVSGSSTTMSVHATGRALDIMLPTINFDADNDLGDPIGEWLIENAETIGIQYIIWDEWTWMASRPVGEKDRSYGGANPHYDHLHVELSVEAAMQTDDWFSSHVSLPFIDGCVPLGGEGGVIDELDPCFQAFGPFAYWRSVSDAGYGGTLLWTDAWQTSKPSNWARWNIALEEAGSYEVEVFLTAPWAVHAETRYGVRHAGEELSVVVDQGAAEGWVALGTFDFAAGEDQWVSVYDNVTEAVADDQHIMVDALRLRRVGNPIEVEPRPQPMPEPEPMSM